MVRLTKQAYSGCVEDACDMIILLPEQVTKRTVAEIEIQCSEASELCSRTDTDFLHYAKKYVGNHLVRLTNRFQVAVRLFSNRSQMTSKCGKNKKVTQSHFFLNFLDVYS